MSGNGWGITPGVVPLGDSIADEGPSVDVTVGRREALDRMFAGMKGRDLQILTMLSEGYTAQEIADELGLMVSYARKLIVIVREKARAIAGDVE